MSKPYDATSKDLIESGPEAWVTFFGRPTGPGRATTIDADVSTVTAGADKVIRVEDDPAWVLHLEFQSGHETGLPRRVLRYNALLQDRHDSPVASAVFLLRPAANATDLTGEFRTVVPVGPVWTFRYLVVRVWEQPTEVFLTGGLPLLPFAPLGEIGGAGLTSVVGRMKDRIDREAPPPLRGKLWSAAYVLMGLRYDEAVIEQVLTGVLGMEESVTYQALLRKGRAEEARRIVLLQGAVRFGAVPREVEAAVNDISDVNRLESLLTRIFDADGWDDLLATP